MSCVKKLIAKCFGALAAVLIAAVLAGPAYAASEGVSVSLSISQTFFNHTTQETEDTFSYVLTPLETGNPMPGQSAGSYSFTMKGTEEVKLAQMTFSRTGIYRYELKQTVGSRKKGYIYDGEVYTVALYVTNAAGGGLTVSTEVYTGNDEKADRISFENSYRRDGTSTAPGNPPQTGDNSNPALWVLLLVLSAACLAGAQRARRLS